MQGTIFILLFSACALAQDRPPLLIDRPSQEKLGTCPVTRLINPCECNEADRRCKWDKECPGVQKCCSFDCDCRTRCVNPVGVGSGKGCLYNGKKYRVGESFPSKDGCNTCFCSNGNAMCTRMACFDRCSLPQVVGDCRAAFRRWWYNKKTNRCERFTYGGCDGNENNFESKMECERRCRKRTNRPPHPRPTLPPGPPRPN